MNRTHKLACFLAASILVPSTPVMAQTAQQNKMVDCNKQATGKTGDDRKSFMKSCLSSKTTASGKKLTPQQQKMGACNKQATGKTGDERKAFMKSCLSAS